MRKRLLIIGGSGFLGSNIARITSSDFEVYATYNSNPLQIRGCKFVPLDIRDKNQVSSVFKEIKPDVVIHTAALTLVDYCEEHAGEAWMINVVGTENVALAMKEIGGKLIYISTDAVFNGEKGMYSEEDNPNPLNVYAKTKLEGEKIVQHWLLGSLIIRTAFYGWSLRNKLAGWVVANLRRGVSLSLFTDIFFSPIFVGNLVEVMIEMYHQNLGGVYHVVGSERCSKYDFGLAIAQVFGLDKGYIQPSSVYEVGLVAPRAKDLSLDVTKISRLINTRLLNVEQGIIRFRMEEQ